MTDTPTKATRTITDLADLRPAVVTVRLVIDDDTDVIVSMRTLSFGDWQQIGNSVVDPLPPVRGAKPDGSKIYDYSDSDYLRALEAARELRSCRRLLRALVLPVPGRDEAEQIDYLKGLDNALFNGLVQSLSLLGAGRKATVEARAASFLGGRPDDGSAVQSNGVESEPVVSTGGA